MNYVVENILKSIKISDLPIKEEIDRKSVVLIEDSEDTKQMSVELFYHAIEELADEMFKTIQNKLVEVDSLMKEMQRKLSEWETAEIQRKKNELQRLQDEQERRAQFEIWKHIWESTWEPFYNESVQRENTRIANENSRTQEFNRWLTQMTQWELNEQARNNNEFSRVEEFNRWTTQMTQLTLDEQARKNNETSRIEEFNRWTALVAQWEADEQARKDAESETNTGTGSGGGHTVVTGS